jgi:hypothetical protein
VPGVWYPKHLGFLGAAAPAVPGLRNATFAGPADAVFTAGIGDPPAAEAAPLLRALRAVILDRLGIEDADRALPGVRIEWPGETAAQDPAGRGPAADAAGTITAGACVVST